jgi:eukaryotic-like serine/threonine-protein kinase
MSATILRFGDGFEFDRTAYELRRSDRPRKLERIPMEILLLLLDRKGQLVAREEIIERVWGNGVFLDTDNSINGAISKIRQVLMDDAENPVFIQTVKGKGYRFIAAVTEIGAPDLPQVAVSEPDGKVEAAQLDSLPSAAAISARTIPWIVFLAGTLLFGCLAAAIFLVFFHRKAVLTEKDTVVLSDFTNTTGDPVFDESLRQGMAVELEQSPFLSLVSEGRIQQTLRMMGQPADARLTPENAWELCERTGSAAVLDGSIASLGSHYVLGLRARACGTGDVLVEEQAQAARKEDVLDALSDIANKFRARVGESLRTIEKHDAPLAEATTPSLEALKAFSAGNRVAFSSGSAASLPFFQRAIEIDPKFAMAYSILGHVYNNIGETELSAQSSTKAYELRDRASDEE